MLSSSEYRQCLAHLEHGAALDGAVFASWFRAHKDDAWLKEKSGDGRTPLHLALENNAPEVVTTALLEAWPGAAKEKDRWGDTPLQYALHYKAPEAVVMALIAAWPDAVKVKNELGSTPLYVAIQNNAPEAVVMALLAACPDAVKEQDGIGDTLLIYALQNKATEAVAMALFEAWPDAAKEKSGRYGNTPLHHALVHNAPEAVLTALLTAWTDAVKEKNNTGNTPLHIAVKFKAPEAVVTALLAAWPDAVKEKNITGNTPLHIAVKFKAPEAVVMAMIAACSGAVKEKNRAGNTPLRLAVKRHASDAVVRALVAAFPGALKGVTKITTDRWTKQPTGGGDTVLHTLATAKCSSVAEARNANTICFTLVQKRASLTATNAVGQTPAEASRAEKVPGNFGRMVERKPNPHLVASFREIAAYKKRTHLSVMHFRDWTTVSHAWCTPSAKLVALTVLMVGETYKRGLLPRLPMDCWYFILKCIPRHELRQGGCEPAAEQVALTKYLAILREARGRIDAAAAAAAAACRA